MKAKDIKKLLDLIVQSGLEEVSVETEHIKLATKRIAPGLSPMAALPPYPTPMPPLPSAPHASADAEAAHSNHVAIKAPMVGTFYQSNSPEAPPFVQVGDPVQQGQKLCIIEAMKLFNEIESEVSGTVVQVLVEDASPVEYDQPLFLIAP